MDNPWMIPGRLLVGHRVLRWDENAKEYISVEVKSISGEQRHDVREVYDIHLREGRRSYHANGYLVSVNYPEVRAELGMVIVHLD